MNSYAILCAVAGTFLVSFLFSQAFVVKGHKSNDGFSLLFALGISLITLGAIL